jgi:5-methylcytosine-specific restriction enzyme A
MADPREPRRSAYARGYTAQWARASKAFRIQYPLCGMRPGGQRPVMSQCFDDGRTTAAQQTDHVRPHRGDPILFWDREHNWQSLCRACGTRKSQAGL